MLRVGWAATGLAQSLLLARLGCDDAMTPRVCLRPWLRVVPLLSFTFPIHFMTMSFIYSKTHLCTTHSSAHSNKYAVR